MSEHRQEQEDSLAELARAIRDQLSELPLRDDIHACGEATLYDAETRPYEMLVLAQKRLQASKHGDESLCWRRLYEEASLWKVLVRW